MARYVPCDSSKSGSELNIREALAFGYFEALIRTGDSARVQSEAVRLKSMNNLLSVLRQDADIFEDFVQETLDLLERTRVDMNEDHGRNLLASFNDDGICAAVITHFRVSLFDDWALVERRIPSKARTAYYFRLDEDARRIVLTFHAQRNYRSILLDQN